MKIRLKLFKRRSRTEEVTRRKVVMDGWPATLRYALLDLTYPLGIVIAFLGTGAILKLL